MQTLIRTIEAFQTNLPREIADRDAIRQAIAMDGAHCLCRDNLLFHFSASSIIVNHQRTHTLMAYHNLYQSWAWTGGHADGDPDLLSVALREAHEETGITGLTVLAPHPISLEVLHVVGHVKRGQYVPDHVHLNLTYGLEADDSAPIRNQPDENARVGWLEIVRLPQFVSEPAMIPVYHKILSRILGTSAFAPPN